MLALGVLALVNVYVFFVRDASSLTALANLPAASIGAGTGILGRYAEPRPGACALHPVRIFDGLERAITTATHIGPDRSFRLALLDAGVRGDEVAAAEAAMRTKVDTAALDTVRRFARVAVDRTGGLLAWEIEWEDGHLVQGCREDPSFEVRHVQQPLRTDVVAVGVEVGRDADLAAAFAEAGESFELVAVLEPLLRYDLDLNTELRPGDRLSVLVEKRSLGAHFHRYGVVLGVRFVGTMARFAYYRHDAAPGYFDREGRPHARTFGRSPVPALAVSPLARPLLEPRIETVEDVPGFVYRLPEGAPVVSLSAGTVSAVGEHPTLGRIVEVTTEAGQVVRYAHLGRFVETLEVGVPVAPGRLLGVAGRTGDAPGPRLRVELWDGPPATSKPTDPSILLSRGERRPPRAAGSLEGEVRAAFLDTVRPWSRALRRAHGG